jgi:5-methylcytosine-specific restriction endonuclease McrA
MNRLYDSSLWTAARAAALERDGHRCSVARLLGGRCSAGPLHVHHIEPIDEGGQPFDLDNLGTVCAAHHPQWEALRRAIVARRRDDEARPRCPHTHRTIEARMLCEARLARERGLLSA